MKNKKRIIILSAIALITLALLIVGATYAYFQNQYGSASNADIKVTTYTTDVLTFETGDAINISADQETFAQGKGNKTGSTFARATLQANNKTNTATANYYMYLNIENNTFTYTNTGTPELILQVVDKTSGNPVTSITGLDYVTVTDGKNTSISGFDITNKKGIIALFSNKEISASPKTVEEYTITITLVNHNFDQNVNTGKNLNGKLIIQKEKMITSISDVAKSGDALATVLETLGTKGDSSLTGLYHHDANLTNGARDNSYRYAGGDSCTFNGENVQGVYSNATFGASNETNCQKVYTIKSDELTVWMDNSVTRLLSDEKPVTWTDGACKTMDGESVNIGFVGGNFKSVTEATCKGKSYLVKTDALTARVANLNMEYVGVGTWNNVNNYVCFGSDEATCPHENLYRIIGVIDGKIKLISADGATTDMLGTDEGYVNTYQADIGSNSSYYKGNGDLTKIGSYKWNKTGENTWSTSTTNITNLNTNYLTYLDGKNAKWKTMIADTTWYVGGMTYANGYYSNAKTAYNYEVGANKDASTTVTSKIGLMYVSDYYYAANENYWTLPGRDSSGNDYRTATNDNWLYTGLSEWTISRISDSSNGAFVVALGGSVVDDDVGYDSGDAVRPSFSLSSSIKFTSGEGTAVNPIRINL